MEPGLHNDSGGRGPGDPEQLILWEESLPVRAQTSADQVFDDIAERLSARLRGAVIHSLGVGLPGALDRAAGVIEMSPNLPWLIGVDVRAALTRRLGERLDPAVVRLENDANAAALGEQRFGGGTGQENLLFVTLGTGVGSGLILDGHLFVGAGMASEVGHLCIEPSGLPCGCGSRGCLETLASATAARRRALEVRLPAADPGNLELLTRRARAQAGPERELLLAVGRDLGHGLAPVLTLIDVRCFVFGGGFAAALDVMTPGILEGIEERAFVARPIELLPATLGNRAGWLGAAQLESGPAAH